ncbi:MAG: LysR family transcriptional regulator [Pusillimonas sp.]|nr:MAG: LysR family transcriptional regulator [Pusillimonas sp.]
MKLHQLRDFIAVARAGSIHQAARDLKAAQPALTKSIRQLEKVLGTPLFERTARGTVLNAFGKRFLARAELATNELNRGKDELEQLLDGKGGRIAIALSGTPSMLFLPNAITTFRRRYPEAQVRIVDGLFPVMLPGLRDGSLDFAMSPFPRQSLSKEFIIEPVFRGTQTVVGRRNHPLCNNTSLAGLVGAEWVLTGAAGSRTVEFEQQFRQNHLPVPRADVKCESLLALVSLLSSSDLLAFLPQQWVDSQLTAHALCEIRVRENISSPTICMIRREGLPLTPVAEAFADALIRESGQLLRQSM